jgi:Domain of unknown function (DUF4410)
MENGTMVTTSIERRRSAACIVALSLLAACSTASVTATNSQKPTQAYTIVLGEVTASDDSSQKLLPYFRIGFAQRLQELSGSPTVSVAGAAPTPPDAAVVSGEVLRASAGSAAVRFLIGFGAGSAKMRADFKIRDAAGNLLTEFAGSKSYAGNLGIGGFDVADMNSLMSKFGAQTAEAAWHWSKGEPIETPDSAADAGH